MKITKVLSLLVAVALLFTMLMPAMGTYVFAEEAVTPPDKYTYDVAIPNDFGISSEDKTGSMGYTTLSYRSNMDGVLFDFYLTTSAELNIIFAGGGWQGNYMTFKDGAVAMKTSWGASGDCNQTFTTLLARFNEKMHVQVTTDHVQVNDDDTAIIEHSLWIDDVLVINRKQITVKQYSTYFKNGVAIQVYNASGATWRFDNPGFEEFATREFNFSDFGIDAGRYDLGAGAVRGWKPYNNNASENTMDGTVISGWVKYEGNAEMRCGTMDGLYQGLRVYSWNGNLTFRTVTPDITLVSFAKGSTAANLIFQGCDIKIMTSALDLDGDGNKNDLKLRVWLRNENGLVIGAYVAKDAYNNSGTTGFGKTNIHFQNVAGAAITIGEQQLDESKYTRWGAIDFGLAANEAGTSMSNGKTPATWDKVMFDADITFDRAGGQMLYAMTPAWHGLMFYTSGASYSGDVAFKFNGTSYTTGLGVIAEKNTITAATPGTSVNLKLTTDYVDFDKDGNKDDVKLGIWVNGKLNKNMYVYFIDYVQHMSTQVLVTGNANIVSSVSSDIWKTLSDTYYDLGESENGYLVLRGDSATVNGEAFEIGESITQVGEYFVDGYTSVEVDGTTTVKRVMQTVYLYTMGDLNLDGAVDNADAEILTAAISGTANTLQNKAGDLNNNGELDNADLTLLNEVIGGTNTIADIKAEYGTDTMAENYTGDNSIMPITGFHGPYSTRIETANGETPLYDYCNDSIFVAIKESGINNIIYFNDPYNANPNAVQVLLGLAEKHGIGMYVEDYELRDLSDSYELAQRIAQYSAYDSFKGIFIVDEPHTDNYQPSDTVIDVKHLDNHKDVSALINSYSNLAGYINIYGCGDDAAAYDAYLDEIINDAGAKNLVASYYKFTSADDSVEDAGEYFKTLTTIRAKALENGKVFSAYAQLGGDFLAYDHNTNFNLTEAQTLWQINMPLAFGAKGIDYFPLIQPYNMSLANEVSLLTNGTLCGTDDIYCNKSGVSCGQYHDFDRVGLIGANGQPTTYYAYAQKANVQIAAIDHVLMHAKSKGVIAAGEIAQTNTAGLDGVYNNADDVASLLTNVKADNGALVGTFDYNGTEAYYVVNYDVDAAQEITLTLNDARVYTATQNATEADGIGKTITLTVPAGEGVLVVLGEKAGDANEDNIVNILDYIIVAKFVSAVEGVEVPVAACDYNLNGNVDSNDLIGLKKQLLFS